MSEHAAPQAPSTNVTWHDGAITAADRGARGATLWLTGLSGSGKSSVAVEVEAMLVRAGRPALRLDGDNLRHGLNADLGFSDDDRIENVRRVAEVAKLCAAAGMVVVVPIISPFRAGRAMARRIHTEAQIAFHEVFVDTPLAECEARDPKGLYAQARAGKLSGFTGIDAPYEVPDNPALVLTPSDGDPSTQAQRVVALLNE